MSNIVPTWKNKALSSEGEQGMALVSSGGEVELTDEQLEAIYGGKDHEGGNNEHHEQGGWNNHQNGEWHDEHHEHDGWNYPTNNGWYYFNHHWLQHDDHDKWHHNGH